ncbi:MAG: NTP transferase domain-containing protein, partial [Propionivibrio sp.]
VSVRTPRPDIALPQVCDACPHGGPLAGLAAGLAAVGTSWVFAVATDMPFLRPALIERLAHERDGHQAVVPMVGGHPQPLAAFYSTSALPVIENLLAGKEKNSLRAALTQLNVRYVAESELLAADPGLRSFFDLDTPQDLALALQQEEFGE